MGAKIFEWLDERLDLHGIYDTVLDRRVPTVNWWFTLGSASLFLCLMQGLTGIFLTMYYVPSPDQAYDSIEYIMNGVSFGWLIRGIHHWGASLLVLIVFIHMLRAFFHGAYKYPHEITWLSGVGLLFLTLGMGFTGNLLPWNQKAYWVTTVGTEIVGTVPFIGEFILKVSRGGTDLSALTLARFFSAHIWILPAAVLALLGVHIYLIIHLGISGIPEDATVNEEQKKQVTVHPPPTSPRNQGEASKLPSAGGGTEGGGGKFWPDIIYKDIIVSFALFVLLVGLAAFVGVAQEHPADPSDTSYIPRPEWYFLFFYELLKYIPGVIEWVGTTVIPGIAVLALLLLPFLDKNPKRNWRNRKLAISIMGVIVVGIVALTITAFVGAPEQREVALAGSITEKIVIGQNLYSIHCTECHGPDGEGGVIEGVESLEGVTLKSISSVDEMWTHSDETLFLIIAFGQQDLGMTPFSLAYSGELNKSQIDAIVTFMRYTWDERAEIIKGTK